jgi:hypothetical protein
MEVVAAIQSGKLNLLCSESFAQEKSSVRRGAEEGAGGYGNTARFLTHPQ